METQKAQMRDVPEIPQGVAWAALIGFLAFMGYSLFDMNGRLSSVETGLMHLKEGQAQLVDGQKELEAGQNALEAGQDGLMYEIRELRKFFESGEAIRP